MSSRQKQARGIRRQIETAWLAADASADAHLSLLKSESSPEVYADFYGKSPLLVDRESSSFGIGCPLLYMSPEAGANYLASLMLGCLDAVEKRIAEAFGMSAAFVLDHQLLAHVPGMLRDKDYVKEAVVGHLNPAQQCAVVAFIRYCIDADDLFELTSAECEDLKRSLVALEQLRPH